MTIVSDPLTLVEIVVAATIAGFWLHMVHHLFIWCKEQYDNIE